MLTFRSSIRRRWRPHGHRLAHPPDQNGFKMTSTVPRSAPDRSTAPRSRRWASSCARATMPKGGGPSPSGPSSTPMWASGDMRRARRKPLTVVWDARQRRRRPGHAPPHRAAARPAHSTVRRDRRRFPITIPIRPWPRTSSICSRRCSGEARITASPSTATATASAVDGKGRVLWPTSSWCCRARRAARAAGAPIIADVRRARCCDEIQRAGGKPVMYKTGHR